MLERIDYVEGRGSSVSQKLRMAKKDYSREGWYFVTLSVERRRPLFGAINLDSQGKADMRCNALGQLVERCWCEIPGHYPEVQLGAFQVMPDHFHGLVWLDRGNNKPLGEIMNMFKGAVTRLWRRAMPVDSRYSGRELACIWQLLKASPKRALRMSRKAMEKEIEETKHLLGEAWEGIVVSTFFSLGERAVLDTLFAQPKSRIIWIMPMGMPEHTPVKWGKAMLEGRALWLSAYPDEQQEATRASCMECNAWAERLALELRH
jgi:REP element-mobilizing transposase RayT